MRADSTPPSSVDAVVRLSPVSDTPTRDTSSLCATETSKLQISWRGFRDTDVVLSGHVEVSLGVLPSLDDIIHATTLESLNSYEGAVTIASLTTDAVAPAPGDPPTEAALARSRLQAVPLRSRIVGCVRAVNGVGLRSDWVCSRPLFVTRDDGGWSDNAPERMQCVAEA